MRAARFEAAWQRSPLPSESAKLRAARTTRSSRSSRRNVAPSAGSRAVRGLRAPGHPVDAVVDLARAGPGALFGGSAPARSPRARHPRAQRAFEALARSANTCDTEIDGRKIAKGDKVVMLYQAANRDPAVFDDPETFRIDRKPNDHLAFGIGAHFCLGANLARAEIRIVFRELLRRLPDIRVTPGQGPVRLPSPLVAAVASLPVVFTPEAGDTERPAVR